MEHTRTTFINGTDIKSTLKNKKNMEIPEPAEYNKGINNMEELVIRKRVAAWLNLCN